MNNEYKYQESTRGCGIRRKPGPETTELYWDCLCPERYVHLKNVAVCWQCHARREDRPQSKVIEVLDQLSRKRGEENAARRI